MIKPKAILFDLVDTIIDYRNYNPSKGTAKMLEIALNPNNIIAETIQKYANELIKEFYEGEESNIIQISCKSFHKLIFESYGVSFEKTPLELEVLFIQNSGDRNLINGVREFLDYLKIEGFRIAILSNSAFSIEAMMTELRELEIEDYFEFVITTEDYCIRKPDKRIFDIALTKFNLDASEVWYVGNSFQYDVIGASNANIQSIWYNMANKVPLANIEYCEVKSYNELRNVLEKLDNVILDNIG